MSAGKRPQWGNLFLMLTDDPLCLQGTQKPGRAAGYTFAFLLLHFPINQSACRKPASGPGWGFRTPTQPEQRFYPALQREKAIHFAFLLLHFPNILFIRRMVGVPVRRDKQTIAKLVPKPVAGGASFLLFTHKSAHVKETLA